MSLRGPAAKAARGVVAFPADASSSRRSSVVARATAGEQPPAAVTDTDDLNVLQTALRAAVEREDYAAAAALRDRIDLLSPDGEGLEGWRELGLPEWLADRVERCGFNFPTSVQVPTRPRAHTLLP
jgi:hypothetical protein